MLQATTSSPRCETSPGEDGREHHVCPFWIGYLLASPIRRLLEKPEAILGPHVRPGMTALDVGCAMGYFSLPLARMVGPEGRVVCVDVQERMLARLRKRARRKGLDAAIEPRLATQDSLGIDDLKDSADFALAFHVVHESRYPERFFRQIHAALRPGGRLLVSEPPGHVAREAWEATKAQARAAGFELRGDVGAGPEAAGSRKAGKGLTFLAVKPA